MDLLVYAERPSPRLEWILKEILGRRLRLDYLVVEDAEAYRHGTLPGVTYARKKQGRKKELLIIPAGLLAEQGVTPAPPPVGRSGDMPVLFPQPAPSDLSLDIFAAAFYLLSRYEEYLPFSPGKMGRFRGRQSLAGREGWLERPVVEEWCLHLAKKLEERLGVKHRMVGAGRYLPTYDIDQAFAYRHKSWWRLLVGGLRAGDLRERLAVRAGRKEDPYDTIPEILSFHRERAGQPLFFFHVGRWGRYDKSIPPGTTAMGEIIREVAVRAVVGLHPSVRAAKDLTLIATEKARLEKAAGMPVTRSRMHYLMLRFPGIPRALLESGIEEDYTMGFHDMPGFRAGTCYPFTWYDLQREEETKLQFIPLAVMDGALRQSGVTAGAVPALLDRYWERIRGYGGIFVTLWHNHTFAGDGAWAGWGDAYRRWMIQTFDK